MKMQSPGYVHLVGVVYSVDTEVTGSWNVQPGFEHSLPDRIVAESKMHKIFVSRIAKRYRFRARFRSVGADMGAAVSSDFEIPDRIR